MNNAQWRKKNFGTWSGKYKCYKLRDELRYAWMRRTWLTRVIGSAFPRAIWMLETDPFDPLTYTTPTGLRFRPMDMETDFGSVPLSIQWIIQKDQFLLSFFLHDYLYWQNGCYVMWLPPLEPNADIKKYFEFVKELEIVTVNFRFVELDRSQADALLLCGIGAEGGNEFQRQVVFNAVRAGGGFVWKKRSTEAPSTFSGVVTKRHEDEDGIDEAAWEQASDMSPDDL